MWATKDATNTSKTVAPLRNGGVDDSINAAKNAPKEVSSCAPLPKASLDESVHAPKTAADQAKEVAAPRKATLNKIIDATIRRQRGNVMEPKSTGSEMKEDVKPNKPLDESKGAPKNTANEVKDVAATKAAVNTNSDDGVRRRCYMMAPTSTGWKTEDDVAPKKPLDDSKCAPKNAANEVKNIAPIRKPGLDDSLYAKKNAPKEVSSFAPPPKATSNITVHAQNVANTAKSPVPTLKKEVSSFAPSPKFSSNININVHAQNAANTAKNAVPNLKKEVSSFAPPPKATSNINVRAQNVAKTAKNPVPTLKKEVSSFAPPPNATSNINVRAQNVANKAKGTISDSREAEKIKPATLGANFQLPKYILEGNKWPAPAPRETALARKKRLTKVRKNRKKAATRLRSRSESSKSVSTASTSSKAMSTKTTSSKVTSTSTTTTNTTSTKATSTSITTTNTTTTNTTSINVMAANATVTNATSSKTTSPESVSSEYIGPKKRGYRNKRPPMVQVCPNSHLAVCPSPPNHITHINLLTSLTQKQIPVNEMTIMASATRGSPTISGARADTHTPNPEAPPFEPAPNSSRGVATPTDFMAAWRAKNNAPSAPVPSIPPRCIVFKNVPERAALSDVLCLVFGGPIESVSSHNPNEVTVQFIEADDCKKYYETVRHGIRIGHHLIQVEQQVCEPLDQEMKHWIMAGTTRVVRVDVPNHKTLQDLHDVAVDLEIDHVMYHTEPNMVSELALSFLRRNTANKSL